MVHLHHRARFLCICTAALSALTLEHARLDRPRFLTVSLMNLTLRHHKGPKPGMAGAWRQGSAVQSAGGGANLSRHQSGRSLCSSNHAVRVCGWYGRRQRNSSLLMWSLVCNSEGLIMIWQWFGICNWRALCQHRGAAVLWFPQIDSVESVENRLRRLGP